MLHAPVSQPTSLPGTFVYSRASKTLTGYWDAYKGVEGHISYEGLDVQDVVGSTAYCPEDDIHFPILTVDQTLRFAAAARTPSKAGRPDGMSRQQYTDLLVDLYLTLFGLRQQAHTKGKLTRS